MINDEYGQLTGETAVTFNVDVMGHLNKKYRAVEVFAHEINGLSLLAPGSSSQIEFHEFTETRKYVSVPSCQVHPVPITQPNTSVNRIKCPEKPCFVPPNTSFFASESNYEKLKEKMEKALGMLEEFFDWSYFESDCMWKCKYFHGSSLREKHVYCYWDSVNEDHIIEVKRVQGDSFHPSFPVDFFSKLKSVVTNSEEELSHSKKGGKLRGPLPLPMLGSLSNTNQVPSSLPPLPLLNRSCSSSGTLPFTPLCAGVNPGQVSEEQFLAGIQPLYSMSTDQYYEPRVEAAKMLCDLATKESRFLEMKECHEMCVKSLDALLLDDFEDVKQFAVMAIASFAELPLYQRSFLELKGLESLIYLLNNSSRDSASYQTAQMRRKAAQGLSLIARSHPRKMCETLKRMGYESKEVWLDHCAMILDKRTREFAMTLGSTY